jgi:DNA-binding IclR family transcriptional regulator
VPSSKVPAADSALRVLGYLATRSGPVSAASIAAALELPRSSVYHLLRVMLDRGFVVHLPEERLYGLGIMAFELSSAYVRHDPMARLGAPLLRRLVDAVGESAHLAVLHGRDVVYVVEERAAGRPSLVTDVGVRIPAHLTASGRSMLAGLPPAQVRALYPDRSAFASRTSGTAVTSPSRLRAELARTRARGWAVEDGDVTPDFASVAVAAHDHRGLPVAGLAVTFLAHRVDEDRRQELVGHLRRTAGALSARLHGSRAPA